MTVEENILASIGEDLAAITAANGYKTTVVTVEPFVRDECVGAESRPWIGYAPATSPAPRPDYFASTACMKCELFVVTQLFLADMPGLSKRDALRDFVDDVIGAMHANTGRALNATPTTPNALNTRLFEGPITDEADPEWLSNGVGEAIMVWRVEYNRSTTHEAP